MREAVLTPGGGPGRTTPLLTPAAAALPAAAGASGTRQRPRECPAAQACVHTHAHTHTHSHALTHTHVHTYTHVHTQHTSTHMLTHTHVHTRAHIHTCARIQARTDLCTLTHTHTRTHVHTHTYTVPTVLKSSHRVSKVPKGVKPPRKHEGRCPLCVPPVPGAASSPAERLGLCTVLQVDVGRRVSHSCLPWRAWEPRAQPRLQDGWACPR